MLKNADVFQIVRTYIASVLGDIFSFISLCVCVRARACVCVCVSLGILSSNIYAHTGCTAVCVCVCVCEREGGGECSLGWNGSLPFMNIQSPPAFPLMSHWCQLACGKTSCPGNNVPPKLVLLLQKNHRKKSEKETERDREREKGISTVVHP